MKAKKTLKETAVEGIYRDIEEGIYKANVIITEGEIVDRYSMSKSPVREALIELCKDGVLKSIPRVGYQVVQISIKEILDLLEVRIDLESANLRRVAPRITSEDLEMLKNLETIANSDENHKVAVNWDRNSDFHIKLCELGGNAYLCETIERALMKSRQYTAQYFHNAWNKNAESNGYFHRATIDALQERDVEKAVSMLQKDILNVRNQIQESFFL